MDSSTTLVSANDDFDPFAGDELERVVPTTESQREIWLAIQLGREASLAYNQVTALRLSGALSISALAGAISALADRHEALRATLSADGMELLIARSGNVPLHRIDLHAIDEAAQKVAVDRECARAVEAPFDLTSGPLLRAQLLALGPREHVLLLAAHHIICDGWSLGVIAKDLAALYTRAGDSAALALPPADRFSDYAAAEASRQEDPRLAAHERYWLSRFEGELPRLNLPLDHRRPAVRSFASRREDRLLDVALTKDLRRLARGAGTSLFSVLAAGFAALLARICGQQEVVIGVPSAGQSRSGMHDLVGHCVNLLPIRLPVDPGATAIELLASTRDLLLDALEHQEYTFGTLLQKLHIARDPGRIPLVGVMFNLDQAFDAEHFRSSGIGVDLISVPRHFEAFELFVNVAQCPDGLRLECQYNTDLLSEQTVGRWLGSYEALLRGFLDAPTCLVKELPVIDSEQRRGLVGWNETTRDHDRNRRVHDLIEAQMLRVPGRVAVTHAGATLTYGDLRSRSNRLARALRARGLGRGALVGLCVERGSEMVVGQLAILQVGAAYVPLDPAYPPERLAYMARDAGLAVLLTQAALSTLIEWPRESTLLLDTDAGWIAAQSDAALPADEYAARPEDPAYVIYTSGTTGKPKGTIVPHRAVVNFLTSMAREPGLHESDKLVAVTTLSFDIAVLELLLPLCVGAQVVLASREQAGDGHALGRLLESSGAAVMQATPSTWQLLIESGWQGSAGFKALVGGEALRADLAEQLLARTGELWNMYGPTETTVWSTCCKVEHPQRGISIGRPIANSSVWIVDEHGQLCPIGTAGEIFIGGEGVTLGYLDRPELTAERFVADTFGASPHGRLYRTGDLGRWRHDGLLEHLGRLDLQVKVRGHRIELGEIETNLALHPAVSQCVVVTREDRPSDVRIVAYVVPRAGADATTQALRDHLRLALPDYMVPQHFMQLKTMPRLPNGKTDRNALPSPEPNIAAAGHVAPRSETEARLAAIWADVLGVERVGVHDTFFELGGHSLLALKLLHRIEQDFNRALRLATLFDAPTVSRLAVLLSGETIGQPATCAVAIKSEGGLAPLFFVSGWGGAIIGFNALARELHPEQPLYVLDTTVFGSPTHPVASLTQVAAQMIHDMRRIQPEGPYHLCGFSQGGKFVYEIAQALHAAGEPVGLLALMDCDAPGYPGKRAAASRIVMHLRQMLRQSRSENFAYLRSRLSYFYRHLTKKDADLFGDDTDVAATSVAQAIQHSADEMTKAWEDYTPTPYPGSLLLIAAGIRDFRPSLIDDDRLLGWGAMIGQGIALQIMNAHHVRMIEPSHAPELAGILSDYLEKPVDRAPQPVQVPRSRTREKAAAMSAAH